MTFDCAFPNSLTTTTTTSSSSSSFSMPFSSSCSFSPPSSSSQPGRNPTSPSSPLAPQALMNSADTTMTPRAGKRRFSHHCSTSPTANRPLIGTYSESLLRGRMSTMPSMPFPFQAELGVLGTAADETPRHLKVDFDARFYVMGEEGQTHRGFSVGPSSLSGPSGPRSFSSSYLSACSSSLVDNASTSAPPSAHNVSSAPYVGTIELDAHFMKMLSSSLAAAHRIMPLAPPAFPGYAIPPRGQVQVLVKNPDLHSAVKVFLVPYDLRGMPQNSKTFIRKKICVQTSAGGADQAGSARKKRHSIDAIELLHGRSSCKPRESLRYAIHLQFACVPKIAVKESKVKRSSQVPDLARSDEGTPADAGCMSQFSNGRSQDHHSSRRLSKPSSVPVSKYFLYGSIRVVFSPRPPEKEDAVNTYIETPAGMISEEQYLAHHRSVADLDHSTQAGMHDRKFSTFSGQSDEWESLRKEILRARKLWKSGGHARGLVDRGQGGDGNYDRQATDASGASFAAATDLSADISASSVPSDCYGVARSTGRLDSCWKDGEDRQVEVSEETPHVANPDPNGEHWEEEPGTSVPQVAADLDDHAELHRKWSNLTIGASVRASFAPPQAENRIPEVGMLAARVLRRERSHTITPTSLNHLGDQHTARKSHQFTFASSLPISPTTADGQQSRFPISARAARPVSPFAPPLSIQTLSGRPASPLPALPAMTPTHVKGVTSPLSTPTSPGAGTTNSYARGLPRKIPYHVPAEQKAGTEADQRKD